MPGWRSNAETHCETSAELDAWLGGTFFRMPAARKDLKKDHRERWILSRVLRKLNRDKALRFPIVIQHGDKPDFIISLGTEVIGLEVVEAVPEQLNHARAVIAKSAKPPNIWNEQPFGRDSPKRSRDEILQIIGQQEADQGSPENANFLGWGYRGYQPEVGVAEAATRVILEKVEKQEKYAWGQAARWLAIYENGEYPPIHAEVAQQRLFDHQYWRNNLPFSRIFWLVGGDTHDVLHSHRTAPSSNM